MSATSTHHVTRSLAVLTVAAGLAHLPVTPQHLREAPYMGVLFATFAAVGVVLGAVLLLRPRARLANGAGVLCGAAIGAYVATRVVAFPQIGDDVGNWAEPWGVVSVALEAAVVVVAVLSRRGAAAASRRGRVAPVAGQAVQQHVAA
jgi:hypothetical protein